MTDDLRRKRDQDRVLIKVDDEEEVRYWTREFGVSERMLRKLVAQHGPVAGVVRGAARHPGR